MTVLPSPIPHPLDYSPFDLPGWAYEALEWVVGFDWPAGNEVTTWDVADRWYALATSLAGPRDEALTAAGQILSGYGGAGITADGFRTAWQQLAGDENAPLNALLQIAHELGELVEECGNDLEAAKLEAWIEIGLFLIELIGMTVAVALTLGAATPAAGGLMMATRLAVQQIFKRLIAQLGRKALKESTQRAVRDLTSRQGLRKLGQGALREGFDEAGEEAVTNASVQAYQLTGDRKNGVDLNDLGMSAAGGFAGGMASKGADIGSHGHGGNPLRGAGGEVLAEFGAAAVHGDLPDAENLAKSATSGAAGSTVQELKTSAIDVSAFGGTPEGAGAANGSALAGGSSNGEALLDGSPNGEALLGGSSNGEALLGGSLNGGPVSSDTSSGGSLSSGFSSNGSPAGGLSGNESPSGGFSSSGFPGGSTSDAAPAIGSSDGRAVNALDAALGGPHAGIIEGQATTAFTSEGRSVDSAEPQFGTVNGSSSAHANSLDARTVALDSVDANPAPVTPSASPTAGGPDLSYAAQTPETQPAPPVTSPPTAATTSITTAAPDFGPTTPLDAARSPGETNPQALTTGSPSQHGPNLALTPDSITVAAAPTAFPTTALTDLPPATTPATTTGPATTTMFPAGQPIPPQAPGNATRHLPRSDLERIADALAPRPIRPKPLPDLSVLAPTPPKRPAVISAPLPDDLARAPRFPVPPAPPGPVRDEAGYFGYAAHARRTHELNRREDYVEYLAEIAEDHRIKILDLGRQADAAFRVGSTLSGADYHRRAVELHSVVAEIETQIDLVRSGELAPATIEVEPRDWHRINTDVGNLTPAGIRSGDRSALPDGRPPIDRTRRYHTYGGLRPPLAVHQLDLENAVPRHPDGRTERLPDPRTGDWFRLANDGGPEADSTRGLNCVDGVLALYDTYIHARPRVAAPRTFDSYAHGNPERPLGGEWNGVQRIEETTGSTFQNLCPYVGGADPTLAKPAIDTAFRNLTNHLHNNGHGAYAFIVTDLEGGGAHSWAAVNQNGTILFLDPQLTKISENHPIYRHHGVPTTRNIISMDALVVTGEGKPAPLPFHGPGQWRTPTGAPPAENGSGPSDYNDRPRGRGDITPEKLAADWVSDADLQAAEDAAERQAFKSLQIDEQQRLNDAYAEVREFADQALAELRAAVSALPISATNHPPQIVDEETRRKTPDSMARAFLESGSAELGSLTEFLDHVKDRVRFSVEVAEVGYGNTVLAILGAMADRGYAVGKVLSFWGTGSGRHNGLNVTLTSPDGRLMEVQFPTPLSRQVGKLTHLLYKRVRTARFSPEQRIEALLRIVSINHEHRMPEHQPDGLEKLKRLARFTSLETSFASWISSRPTTWDRYLTSLTAAGVSFESRLAAHNLPDDLLDQ